MDTERRAHERLNRGKSARKTALPTESERAEDERNTFVYTLSERSSSEDDEEHDDSYFIPTDVLVVELSDAGTSSSKMSHRMSIHFSD